jgi:hypothetical protein
MNLFQFGIKGLDDYPTVAEGGTTLALEQSMFAI